MGCCTSNFLLAILVCLLVGGASGIVKRHCNSHKAHHGFDISSEVSLPQFKKLSKNYSFVIIRAYRSKGEIDGNAQSNINYARAAGFRDVDVYMFPCFNCTQRPPIKTAAQQVQNLTNNTKNYSRIWLDIEDNEKRSFWPSSRTKHRRFFEDLVMAAGNSVGVYTSKYNWERIMGCDYHGGAQLHLWYARWNGKKILTDYHNPSTGSKCGGWQQSKIVIKQYINDTIVHGVKLDENWR